MKALIVLITISQLCQASFKAGQCDQWCKDYPDFYFDGGIWQEKTKECRCFIDFDRHSMGMMRMPYTIKKTPPENGASL